MKLNRKKTMSLTQRKALEKACVEEYSKVQLEHEKLIIQRCNVIYQIALHNVLENELSFGEQRRRKFVNAFISKVNEISDLLGENFAEYNVNGKMVKGFDIEGNREFLSRACKQYGISYDESIFNDKIYSEEGELIGG